MQQLQWKLVAGLRVWRRHIQYWLRPDSVLKHICQYINRNKCSKYIILLWSFFEILCFASCRLTQRTLTSHTNCFPWLSIREAAMAAITMFTSEILMSLDNGSRRWGGKCWLSFKLKNRCCLAISFIWFYACTHQKKTSPLFLVDRKRTANPKLKRKQRRKWRSHLSKTCRKTTLCLSLLQSLLRYTLVFFYPSN